MTQAQVAVDVAWRTPQFWLLWMVLCMNVTAGIGVLSQASPMIQEIFTGRVTPQMAAGFVGLLSLFNMIGRFFWASASDYMGRRNTYFVFFALGILLYSTVPSIGYARFDPAVHCGFRDHHLHVRRRLRHHPGVSARHLRHHARGRHSRTPVDRVVGRGRARDPC